ncbi:MGDG synthase family glycosyltransferase [Micromonospora robiginosa]|uniref:UDP-N-acetylglucosamine--LPS N-acetylglucosamine transferase n=1 Tax=Micromonospora robiginosa TaxID=2749844 RepID=A0A7L6B2V6_9ACTN|nr:glycosyltransferase [Micromonospora ferruginea]QLQ36105.1 UDP-N-acetylglucosamine--LPS N-acetylglucosamine transferase [Micromonospora ferruginea]
MEHPGRIVVISADIGAGHDRAADELAARLRGRGFEVDRLNLLHLLPGPLHQVVRETYRGVLERLPWGYHLLFRLTSRSRTSVRAIRALMRPFRARIRRRIPPDTRAVVTTYPFANQLLGPLRRRGRLRVPVLTYVTDLVVHPTWLAPGVDVYCTVRHAELRRPGDVDVAVVQPLVARAFADGVAVDRRRARQRFGLPPDGALALIVAGSWGAGEVAATTAEVGSTGVRPVVVCGRNRALYRRLRGAGWHVLGWVDDMPALMRAVDVVVENAGGLTCQEALVAGVPVVTYRPLPGHGRANATILARSGLTRWAGTPEQLGPLLAAVVGAAPPAATRDGPPPADPAGLVAEAARRAAPAGPAEPERRSLLDPVGDAVAVVAALLQSTGGLR